MLRTNQITTIQFQIQHQLQIICITTITSDQIQLHIKSNQCKRSPKARAVNAARAAAGADTDAPDIGIGAGAGASAAAVLSTIDEATTMAIIATAKNLSFNVASISNISKEIRGLRQRFLQERVICIGFVRERRSGCEVIQRNGRGRLPAGGLLLTGCFVGPIGGSAAGLLAGG